ncbi:MAG: SRPBCC family protein [Solirubrobacteraceae bacterium]
MPPQQKTRSARGRACGRKLVAAVALAAGYWFPVRRWFSRWGATPEELTRPMAGDALISDPTDVSTGGITVNARPEDIWPWLVQIGYQRGGLYSYDWLDRLFGFLDRPSATVILPEFQHIAVGDKIPWDSRGRQMTVQVVEPLRALALSTQMSGFMWVWQFGLYPIDDRRTRLVDRGTEHVPANPLWWLFMRISEPAAFIMTRRFMLGVKQRAEALQASAPAAIPFPGATPPAGVDGAD